MKMLRDEVIPKISESFIPYFGKNCLIIKSFKNTQKFIIEPKSKTETLITKLEDAFGHDSELLNVAFMVHFFGHQESDEDKLKNIMDRITQYYQQHKFTNQEYMEFMENLHQSLSLKYTEWKWKVIPDFRNITYNGFNQFCNENPTLENYFQNWCDSCKAGDDCLDGVDAKSYVKKYLARLMVIPKVNLAKYHLDLVTSYITNPKLTPILPPDFLIDYDKSLSNTSTPNMLQSWKYFNPTTLTDLKGTVFENVQDSENHPPMLPKIRPRIHGNFSEDFVLIPLCSFGSVKMTKCELFEPSKVSLDNKKCYTFNVDGKAKVQKIGPSNGLVLTINHRMPKEVQSFVELIIHEPNTDVDLFNIRNLKTDIVPGKLIKIGLKAKINNFTSSFEDMAEDERDCKLSKDKRKYSKITCIIEQMIETAKDKFQCVPWYVMENIPNETICSQDQSICFEESIEEQTDNPAFLDECPEECMYTAYTTSQMIEDYGNIHKTGAIFGDQWQDFISETNLQRFANIDEKAIISEGVKKTFADLSRNVPDIKFKIPLGGLKIDIPLKSLFKRISSKGSKGFHFEEMIEMTTLIRINFDAPDATVVTKDSKYTTFDKISSIGGTFGIFIGLSIMGIIDFFLWLYEIVKKISKRSEPKNKIMII